MAKASPSTIIQQHAPIWQKKEAKSKKASRVQALPNQDKKEFEKPKSLKHVFCSFQSRSTLQIRTPGTRKWRVVPCSPGLGRWARHTWHCWSVGSSHFSSVHRSNYDGWSESHVYFIRSLSILVNILSFAAQIVHVMIILLDQIFIPYSFLGQNMQFSGHFSGKNSTSWMCCPCSSLLSSWDILPATRQGSPCQQNQCQHLAESPLGHGIMVIYIYIFIYIYIYIHLYIYIYTFIIYIYIFIFILYTCVILYHHL